MKKSSISLVVFGAYLVGTGTGLVFMPSTVLGILGLPPTDEVWIRVLGVVTLVLAYYYIQAARTNLRTFASWTVPARILVFFFFTGFVLAGWVGPVMSALGAIDLVGALWTAWALRKEKS